MANSSMSYEQKWDYYDKTFMPLVEKCLAKIKGDAPIWYEVYIDLDETFERWFNYMFNYPNLAAYSLARWMIKRDSWYWSPKYVKALNKSMEAHPNNPEACFTEVLNNSLN